MIKHSVNCLVTAVVLVLTLVVAPSAHANVLLADILVEVDGPLGDARAGIELYLNGNMIPAQDQILHLNLGDTLRVEIDAFAFVPPPESPGETPEAGDVFPSVAVNLSLDDSVDRAAVWSRIHATANASGFDAVAESGGVDICFADFGCTEPDDPGGAELGGTLIRSDPLFGNLEITDFVEIPNGRFGGEETILLEDRFVLDRQQSTAIEGPRLDLIKGVNVSAFEDGMAMGTVSWELTVIPVPPAFWLFGSALGLLGWLKRRAG